MEVEATAAKRETIASIVAKESAAELATLAAEEFPTMDRRQRESLSIAARISMARPLAGDARLPPSTVFVDISVLRYPDEEAAQELLERSEEAVRARIERTWQRETGGTDV